MQTTINTLEYGFLSNFGFNSDEERRKLPNPRTYHININLNFFERKFFGMALGIFQF